MRKIIKIVEIINNLRNILMLGNSQNEYFEKSYYVSN